jgi:AraC-like DNA-binding protein
MKSCFKGVFGTSIHAYLRKWRVEQAAQRLTTGRQTIAAIAASVGYDSPSKFAQAFNALMGTSPREYRRRFDNQEKRGSEPYEQ